MKMLAIEEVLRKELQGNQDVSYWRNLKRTDLRQSRCYYKRSLGRQRFKMMMLAIKKFLGDRNQNKQDTSYQINGKRLL